MQRLLRYRTAVSVLSHALLFATSLFVSLWFYHDFKRFDEWLVPLWLPLAPLVVIIKLLVFAWMGLYHGWWRYVGIRDMLSLIKAAYIGTFGFIVAYYVAANVTPLLWGPVGSESLFVRFPATCFFLDFGITTAFVCGARIAVRLYREYTRPVASGGPINCLILGAGDTGEAMLREILRMQVERFRVVGFLEDDPAKRDIRIHGVPVLGGLDDVRRVAEEHQVDDLLVATAEVEHKRLRRVVELSQGTNLRFRTIPPMEDMIGGRVTVSQIRDVDINDLLGREQVHLDAAGISSKIRGQRVLITGAGGSIGSEMCRQVMRFQPARLILVELSENNLFEIDRELAALAPEIERVTYIADIKDRERTLAVFRAERPHLVFHAAAHKHVPMMEINVGEAIKNNVCGTQVVADAALATGVSRLVMISTDKAVNPTSVMGATKRVAEMYIQQLGDGAATQFMTVRFGNVLGSSGSVVPIFRRQIAAGGPVTVTDPRMTRYFMTIPEASQLVLQAGVMGTHGDIFVLDMGEPVKILDLAKEMITLSGLRPGEDIEIVFTGVRPGEKLYEELNIHGEDVSPTQHAQIGVYRKRPEEWDRVRNGCAELVRAADREPPERLREMIGGLVPEYQPGGAPSREDAERGGSAGAGRPQGAESDRAASVTTGG
ncbi:MAG: nucleoside-diphosphate sugar epimerase/dehydratase [Phycisphaerae bacterium]